MRANLMCWSLKLRLRSEDLGLKKAASVITLWERSPPSIFIFLLGRCVFSLLLGLVSFPTPSRDCVLWGKALPLAKFPITFSMWNSTHTGASWPCWDSPTERLEGPQQDAQAQIVLVIRADRRKALCFEKSLLGIRETLGVFRLASELGRFFKDTLIVYNQAQGITGEFSAVGMQWDAWR